jgi:hypothetical protein
MTILIHLFIIIKDLLLNLHVSKEFHILYSKLLSESILTYWKISNQKFLIMIKIHLEIPEKFRNNLMMLFSMWMILKNEIVMVEKMVNVLLAHKLRTWSKLLKKIVMKKNRNKLKILLMNKITLENS